MKLFHSFILALSFISISLGGVVLTLEGDDVNYSSSDDIAGFQFNVDGATVTGASGGDASANGFTISNSSSTV